MNTPGTFPRRANTGTPPFQADPINSTFRWEFYLTPGYTGNKVAIMDGYSKGFGFENPNKPVLLYKKLINPILPYLVRCDKIYIYQQNRNLPKELHTGLIELYPDRFVTHDWVRDNPEINQYMEAYYREYVHTGTMPPLEDRRKNVRQQVYFKELDHTKYNFKTQQELKDFCASKVEVYSRECMLTWYKKHEGFQPELFQPDIKDALTHTIHTAKTAEVALGAAKELESLYGKFPSNR